jgi:Ca2+-binding RTX toxin-like protein
MPIYRFSALSDGQQIRFNPQLDDLIFDQSLISAADMRVTDEGAHTRIRLMSGPYIGKDVLLLNVDPQQLAGSNLSFANGSTLLFGDNSSARNDDLGNSLTGTAGRDHIAGFGGNDTLDGGAGADFMDGGSGNDRFVVTSGDVLVDSGGIDTVVSSVNWTLTTGFENLTLIGPAISGNGNSAANIIIGNASNNFINGREGNDSLYGGAGNDTFIMSNGAGASYGQDHIEGGSGIDTVDFGAQARSPVVADLSTGRVSGGGTGGAGGATLVDIENVNGGAYADRLTGTFEDNFLFGYFGNDLLDGGGGRDRLEGSTGNDTLAGGEGNDTLLGDAGDDWLYGGFAFATAGNPTGNDLLTGGPGLDRFVFNDNPNPFISSPTATADRITDFSSAFDSLVFDDNVFPGVGAPGRFQAGDARFAAGAGFTAGRDASDRVIYNTSTGNLYYDPDGSGGGAAQIIATLQGLPSVAATDISVI